MKKDFGIVLLAAGSSRRLGRPKQSLMFKGKTLLQHSLEAATASNATLTVVVSGANAGLLQPLIRNDQVKTILNNQWREGMSSSIICGVEALLQINDDVEGLVLMVCDQPFIRTSVINELISVHQNTGKLIVTCVYGETFGPPTLFHKSLFPELMKLSGDIGAKNIIKNYPEEVGVVLFPEGLIDIDTEADYRQNLKEEL